MRRREFLGASALLLADARLGGMRLLASQGGVRGRDLKEELSAEEAVIVGRSAMAQDLGNFFGKGFS